MPDCADQSRRTLTLCDDAQRPRFMETLGHVGFGEVREGDPTPEERAALDAEFMSTPHRHLLLDLRERERQGQDTGELEAFRRHERRERDLAMQELGALLSGERPRRMVKLSIRRPRRRARRVGCARRRGSRRSTGTGSRAGPGDDPGESDPGDDHSPLAAGAVGGRRA